MGRITARITGLSLSIVTVLLGTIVTVLLYFAGQRAIELFYYGTTTDPEGRIHRQNPADDGYGQLLLKGWIAGFIYILPGITGISSSLFYNTPCTVLHVIVLVLMLTVGSFVHCGGAMLLILYRVLVVEGATRYQPFLGDCIYVDDGFPYNVTEDERCLAGRKAMLLALSALGVMFVTWIFMLSDILFRSCTAHKIKGKKANASYPKRPARRTALQPQSKRDGTSSQQGVTKPQTPACPADIRPSTSLQDDDRLQQFEMSHEAPNVQQQTTEPELVTTEEVNIRMHGPDPSVDEAAPMHPENTPTSVDAFDLAGIENLAMVEIESNVVDDYSDIEAVKL